MKEYLSAIPINHSSIDQTSLNIENKTRSNLFTWNGQFSPQLIEVLLDTYANSGDLVVDPFLGSGTVLYECARQGINAYGIELNPSAFHMAKIYEMVNIDFFTRHEILNQIDGIIEILIEEPNESDIIKKFINEIKNQEDPIFKNILFALIILMDLYKNEITPTLVNKKWKSLRKIIIELPYDTHFIKAENGDARHLNLKDNSADLIITSPPYINVLNYHQKYRKSVEALGYDVLKIAKSEFGSNRKNRQNRFLTVVQYTIDLALALKEASRVCKSDSRMIYIVGRESTILGYSFCNSEILLKIAENIFNLRLDMRQERHFTNRYGQDIYEDILHFRNIKTVGKLTEDQIIEKAKSLAVDILLEQCKQPDMGKKFLLISAIEKAPEVNKSEDYYG